MAERELTEKELEMFTKGLKLGQKLTVEYFKKQLPLEVIKLKINMLEESWQRNH